MEKNRSELPFQLASHLRGVVNRFVVGLVAFTIFFLFTQRASCQDARQVLDAVSVEPRMGNLLPLTAEFRDHLGNPISLNELMGQRPIVLCLVYFDCPMLCKLAADGLVRTVASLPETVGKDFDIVLISFDPRDTPEQASAARDNALRQYAKEGTNDGWHFLTGSQDSIDQVTGAVGFHYVWDEASQQFAHAAGLTIVSPSGVISGYLDGVQFSPKELITAIKLAANEEQSPRQPTSFVRCYLYDPTTGRFGAAVQWTIRVLGLMTVALLGGTIFWLHRRERVQSAR